MLLAQIARRSSVVASQRFCFASQIGRSLPLWPIKTPSVASPWGLTAQAAQVPLHTVIIALQQAQYARLTSLTAHVHPAG